MIGYTGVMGKVALKGSIVPFNYPGSKSKMLSDLYSLLPNHITCVDVFGGSGAFLLNKPKSQIEVYNDVNRALVTFFRVVRDRCDELVEKLEWTPYSRYEQFMCRKYIESLDEINCENELEVARCVFVMFGQCYNGARTSWRVITRNDVPESKKIFETYYSKIEKLKKIRDRLREVYIECYDFVRIFEAYDSEDTLFYCDPPYVKLARRDRKGDIYMEEMTNERHEELVDILLNVKGKVMLSGYSNKIYERLEKNGFTRYDFKTNVSITHDDLRRERDMSAIESVWVNYEVLNLFSEFH